MGALIRCFLRWAAQQNGTEQRKQRLEQERQTIAERVEQVQRQQKQQSIKAQIIDEFAAFCAFAQKALENPTPEVKQEVLRLLVESIVVEDNAITIKHIIPTDDNSRLLPRDNMQKHPNFQHLTRHYRHHCQVSNNLRVSFSRDEIICLTFNRSTCILCDNLL